MYKFWGRIKNNPQLAKWGNYARRTAIAVLTNKKKYRVYTSMMQDAC
jgi:hypothetical protein